MPEQPTNPTGGAVPAEQVRAQIAATNQVLARSRQRASQAMAHARDMDRLLHPPSQRSEAAEQPQGAQSEHLMEAMEHELATHLRAVEVHEEAARVQEERGWPERAAAAREHAARARELSRRAREELARLKARAAAAQEQVDQLQRRLP